MRRSEKACVSVLKVKLSNALSVHSSTIASSGAESTPASPVAHRSSASSGSCRPGMASEGAMARKRAPIAS